MAEDGNDDELQVEFGTLAEQQDEAYYDDRSDADDDLEKGRIRFPRGKLYGRDKEVLQLQDIFNSFMTYKENPSRRVVFLGGYSGTGKSALVEEFVQRINQECEKKTPIYISGKYEQLKAGDPFSAISHAVNTYMAHFTYSASDVKELKNLKKRLARNGIYLGSQDARVLTDTLIPSLHEFLVRAATNPKKQNKESPEEEKKVDAMTYGFNLIKFAFVNFMKALAAEEQPVVFFVDDLQWADDASLQVIKNLLTDKSLQYVMFVGAFRSNEVQENFKTIKEQILDSFETTLPPLKHEMEISNLSPDSVGEFIANCIQRSVDDIASITQAVYSKTLGNIFFVRQGLEELVRKNVIYYDVVMFEWQFGDVTRVQLEECMCDDVVEMVQSKLETLPPILQTALAAAAYTQNSFSPKLLSDLLESLDLKVTVPNMEKILKRASQEGLILPEISFVKQSRLSFVRQSRFKFAHDRIREAACSSIDVGRKRDTFLFKISQKLLVIEPQQEWMLFAAAHHLNAIPTTMTDSIQVAELNLKVGKVAVLKGSFSDAVHFFRSGVGRLNPQTSWLNNYQLSLDLYNDLVECEHTLGHQENTLDAVQVIFKHAKTLPEKLRAQYIYVYSKCGGNNQYKESVLAGLEMLALYGIQIPEEPSDKEVKREKFNLRVALRCRSMMCFCKFPIATDIMFTGQMRIAQITLRHAVLSKMQNVANLLGYRMLRLALIKKAITKNLPFVILSIAGPSRQEEKYDKAMMFTNAGLGIMDRFPDEKSTDFLLSKIIIYGTLIPLRMSFRDIIEVYLELHKDFMAAGNTDPGLGAGMHAIICFFITSFPLGSLFEPKLILFEEMSANLGKQTFHAIFSLMRQCLYNLQGGLKASSKPTTLDGPVFNEDEIMAKFQGPIKKMNNRDIATMRLFLAVIFDETEIMDELLDRLDEYPVYDGPLPRQHLRMSYTGFAALILCLQSDKHKKWADTSLQFFEKLSRFGSPNAQPIYACMKALSKPSVKEFDKVIELVGNLGMLNMTGLMNERCGLWLMEQSKRNNDDIGQHVEYLKCAIWCYHDWGATAKVEKLKERFTFLRTAIQEKTPLGLSTVRLQNAMLGIPRSVALSTVSSNELPY